MFGHGFTTQVLLPSAVGQPAPLARTITPPAHGVAHHVIVSNSLFAAIPIAIGVGLLVRRTIRPALMASFAWAALVWWLGEASGCCSPALHRRSPEPRGRYSTP